MKKWLVFVLGIITGIVLTFVFIFAYAACTASNSSYSGIRGLEMFDEPGEYMEYSQFEIFQVLDSGCALAQADDSFSKIVFIIPNENQHFYDKQEIILNGSQRAQRVGTYYYDTRSGDDKTVPAIIIVDGVTPSNSNGVTDNSGITLFDKPGECVSRKNFEIQEVLESGDAIAKEIDEIIYGHVHTTELEVLIPSQDGKSFYNNQIIKVPQGKCARQIGTYKYKKYSQTKVIPIIEIK